MPYDVALDIGLLSPERSPVFDGVAETARSLFNCAACFISIIDEPNDRQFFKAQAGRRLRSSAPRETPLSQSLCQTVVAHAAPLIINDGRTDIRFRAHGAITELGVVAYLGVPIRGEADKPIAALCLSDDRARAWTSDDVQLLQALADGLAQQIELMIEARNSEVPELGDEAPRAQVGGCARVSLFQRPDGQEELVAASGELEDLWGLSADAPSPGGGLFSHCLPEDLVRARASMGCSAARLSPWHHVWRIVTPSGAVKQLHGSGRPVALPSGCLAWDILVQDVTEPAS